MRTPRHKEADACVRRIQIADGCPLDFAIAIESFQYAVDSETLRMRSKGNRMPIRSVAKLLVSHVEGAFEEAVAQITGGSNVRALTLRWFGPKGMRSVVNSFDQFHKVLKVANMQLRDFTSANEGVSGLIGTMREVVFFLQQWPPSRRVVPRHEQGRKGASVRLRSAEERHFLPDWPYCELCWKLSQRAAHIEGSGCEAGSLRDKCLNERFCEDHARETGSLYRRDSRNRERFEDVTQAIYAEIGKDSSFRLRFTSPGDGLIWSVAKSLDHKAFESLALRDLTPVSLLQLNVRYVAYQIATRRPRQIDKAVEIASLQRDAFASTGRKLTLTEIAQRIGVTKMEVSRRLGLGGCIDLERTSPLLFWWPFDNLAGDNIFQVKTPRSVKAQSLRENWKSIVQRESALHPLV